MRTKRAQQSAVLYCAAAALLALAGCSRGNFERDASEVRDSAQKLKPSLREVQGTLTHGNYTSVFKAWVDTGHVYAIEESFDEGPEGPGRGGNTYYPDGPHLMVYESHRTARVQGGLAGELKTTDLEIFFNQKGEVTQQRKAVDGRAQTPEPSEIQAARDRFQALYKTVRQQGGV